MQWVVAIGDGFKADFQKLAKEVRLKILAHARLLQQSGPQLDGLGLII